MPRMAPQDTSTESDSTPGPSGSGSKPPPKRKKTGCITCRVRKKRCDETKPICRICERLGIECMGYGDKRPRWMRGENNSVKVREELSQEIHKAKARRSRSSVDGAAPSRTSESSDPQEVSVADLPTPVGVVDTGWQGWEAAPSFAHDQGITLRTGDVSVGSGAFGDGLQDINTATTDLGGVLFPYTNTNTVAAPPAGSSPDNALDEIWRLLFDPSSTPTESFPSMPLIPSPLAMQNPSAYSTFPIASPPPIPSYAPTYSSIPSLALSAPSLTPTPLYPGPTNFGEIPTMPDLTYLHHYLNVVLPLQFRLICKSIADLVAPLAMTHHQVLSSVSSLAALHLVSQRVKAPLTIDTSGAPQPTGGASADTDAIVATSSHQSAISRLRFLSSQDLTKEDIIVSALFAVSFHLFRGGTDPGWVVALDTARRCLGVVIASSPELRGEKATFVNGGTSPWQRYGPLISVMVWMDIIGSVTQNKPSHLLPMYRKVLRHLPTAGDKGRSLRMERAMGCDNTTFLAYAEIVQLSAYRTACEQANCLSLDEIQRRASAIQQLLDERGWRESTLDIIDPSGPDLDQETKDLVRIMSDVFYHAARAFLGSVVSGTDPTAPSVSTPVSDVISTLSLLEILHPNREKEINRGLILPITLAGSLAATHEQHQFFRSRFANLGKDAEAFGNSKQAMDLIDEVWRRRVSGSGQSVEFREVMRDMGWEQGILLI